MLLFRVETQLPSEMTQLRQWVNWRYELRKDKQQKVPYNPHTLLRASSTNPKTWSTYEHAVSHVSDKTGLGFVLTPPYIGIDLDHCVNADGTLTLVARKVVSRFSHTYIEYYPSGTGIHLFLKGILSKPVKTSLGEMYTTGRFFTVTGRVFKDV